jgi:hypothetical protein
MSKSNYNFREGYSTPEGEEQIDKYFDSNNNKMGKGVYHQMREDKYLALGNKSFVVRGNDFALKQFENAVKEEAERLGWSYIDHTIDPSDLDLNKPTVQEIKTQMQNDYLNKQPYWLSCDEWQSHKERLNQASLPSEYPSINNMFKEIVLKTSDPLTSVSFKMIDIKDLPQNE